GCWDCARSCRARRSAPRPPDCACSRSLPDNHEAAPCWPRHPPPAPAKAPPPRSHLPEPESALLPPVAHCTHIPRGTRHSMARLGSGLQARDGSNHAALNAKPRNARHSVAMEGEMLKGHLDMIVLAALAPGPSHGYGIIQEIRERSRGAFDLPEGTIYPALHRLEKAGYL